MKSSFRLLALVAAGSLAGHRATAQSVGIGTTAPDAKSALEIRATDKGLLIPRLTQAQRLAITSPPQGLMVYQTDGSASGGAQTGFWYYVGTGGWVYLDAASGSGGLTLPYSGTASTIGSVFQITNSGGGIGLRGASASGQGVVGRVNGTGTGQGVVGVKGTTVPNIEDAGVVGLADADYAVYGASNSNSAVVATTNARGAGQAAVVGTAVNATSGTLAAGVSGSSNADDNSTGGVVGTNYGGGAAVGVLGQTSNGYGVRGTASAAGGYGVSGVATDSYGVTGTSSSGVGTYGISTSNSGVQGYSTSSYGVQGTTAAGASNGAGVFGSSTNGGVGVLGTTTTSSAVRGVASGSSGWGINGSASGNSGRALNGFASGTADGLVVQVSGTGRAGYFSQSNSASTGNAVEIITSGTNSAKAGLYIIHPNASSLGSNSYNRGLVVVDAGGNSILTANSDELTLAQQGSTPGVTLSPFGGAFYNLGNTASTPLVVSATAGSANNGAFSVSVMQGKAANFLGNVQVQGTLAKSGGSFKIDHPLDPENQYLYHSFVESPDMMNVYNGNITLNAQGEATVQLPDWFEALNRDFRYQLTPIGAAFTPYVLAEVAGNRFRIAGQPGGKVSWQVTGIRHDKWADENRIPVVEPKEPENRGKYLVPAAYGRPASQGIGYRSKPEAARR
ncbi:hypothetical protein [Hymenobacter negativus]|uniref:Uncharacterized protein n=1 Tax=Hymenobacter negativus TaxID=2795026 RepID=A0ABS3QA36_9BACT|nr:hypothetical protein [Hymenobacter negativus]MBO2008112.1 hypothetical protein [Hymenobacter negativus]